GLSRRPTIFSSVDLPHPEGPMMATNSPSLISRLMLFKAVVSTSSVVYTFSRLTSLIMAVLCLFEEFIRLLVEDQYFIISKVLIRRSDHQLAGLQSFQYFIVFCVLPTKLNVSSDSLLSRFIEHIHPVSTGILVESADGQQELFRRLTEFDAQAQRLTAS